MQLLKTVLKCQIFVFNIILTESLINQCVYNNVWKCGGDERRRRRHQHLLISIIILLHLHTSPKTKKKFPFFPSSTMTLNNNNKYTYSFYTGYSTKTRQHLLFLFCVFLFLFDKWKVFKRNIWFVSCTSHSWYVLMIFQVDCVFFV